MRELYDQVYAGILAELPQNRLVRRRQLALGRKLVPPAQRVAIKQLRVDPLHIDHNVVVTCCVCQQPTHPTQLRAYVNISFCPVSHMMLCRVCGVADAFVKQIVP
jgi:hypothetical protein